MFVFKLLLNFTEITLSISFKKALITKNNSDYIVLQF